MTKLAYRRDAVLSSLLVTLGLSSCGSGEDVTLVSGSVVLEAPVSGSTVTIRSTDGEMLYSETNETRANGSFLLRYPSQLPADFDIEVTGGTVGQGGPGMNQTLRTEVRNHDHDSYAFYAVDPVSTLVSTYHRRHPELANAQAVAAVWRYLRLPSSADSINDTYFLARGFNRYEFMQAANAAGGLQIYLNQLSAQIDKPTQEAPCFSEVCNPRLAGAGGFIAGAVVSGALSYVGAQAAGYVMSEAFGWGNAPKDRQGEIVAMLAEQSVMLGNVISEIQHLEDQTIKSREMILQELAQTKYDLKANSLTEIRSFADSAYQQLYFITQTDPSEPGYADLIQELAKRLESRDLQTDLVTIHNTLVSNAPGESGLFDIWGGIQHRIGFSRDQYPDVADHMAYWYDVQVKILNLLIEYQHYKYPANTLLPGNAVTTFKDRLAIQQNVFLTTVESLDYVDMYYINRTEFPYKERLKLFCSGMFFSPHLDQADRLVGQMRGLEKSLTLRLYTTAHNYAYGARLDSVELQLRNNDTGTIFKAMPVVNGFDSWIGFFEPRTQVGRYLFDGVPYGNYSIVDTTGQYRKMGVNWVLDESALYQVVSFTAAKPFANLVALAWEGYFLHHENGCIVTTN